MKSTSVVSPVTKIIVAIILLQTLFTFTTVSTRVPIFNPYTNDYRPIYDFSYDVFRKLPQFPKEFWDAKDKVDSQQISVASLGAEYYQQPEIIPSWFDWCDKIYGSENHTIVGVYGISMYPSKFDIFAIEPNQSVNISALLYTSFGVELYQGARIVPIYDEDAISVKMTRPSNDILLLTPTYPEFSATWCRVVTFQIKLLRVGNTTINIMESLPPKEIDDEQRTIYGDLYTSGGSVLGLKVPKIVINIHSFKQPVENNRFPFEWLILIIIVVVTGGLYIAYRRRKKKQKQKKNVTPNRDNSNRPGSDSRKL